jgi:hypothetical protein
VRFGVACCDGVGGRSVALSEFGREVCGREDREVATEDEEVLVAGHEVRAPADGESEQERVGGDKPLL